MASSYNRIFTKLVQDDPDFVGMVAYTLYKKQKIEWIQDFALRHNGQEPSEQELAPFHDMSNMPSMINNYRSQAVDLLDEFLEFALADKVEQIRQALMQEAILQDQQEHHQQVEQLCRTLSDSLRTAQDTHQQAVFNKLDRPWHSKIIENIVIGLMTSLITLAAAVFIWAAAQGPEKLIREALQKYTQTDTHQLASPASPSHPSGSPSP